VNFILSVFGSNLVIVFGTFIYLFMAVFLFKFWFDCELVRIKKGYWGLKEIDGVFAVCIWPISLPIYISFKILKITLPAIFKFFDKITPEITVSKDKKGN
jgi:hypothetical protein